MPNNFFRPSTVHFFIERYVGRELYYQCDPESRKILFADAVKQFQLDMIQKFGTLRNYQKHWLKEQGFNSDKEYIENYLAPSVGVKTYHEYQTVMAKKSGFKNRYDRMLQKAKSNGFTSLHELYLLRYEKRGFSSQKEYRDFLCKKWGVDNYSQLTKLKRKLNSETAIPPKVKTMGILAGFI